MKYIIFLICIFISFNCKKIKIESPKSHSGTIDIQNWDFQKDGLLKLEGEWEFYWKSFCLKEKNEYKIDICDINNKNYFLIPSKWSDYKINDKNLENRGYATYILKIIKKTEEPISLKLPLINTAYTLYVNNKKVLSEGETSFEEEFSNPHLKVNNLNIYERSNIIEIVFHVSSYEHDKPGLRFPIKISTPELINEDNIYNLGSNLFIGGIIFYMGIYHLILFFNRMKEFSSFFFGLFCMIIFLRVLITDLYFLYTLIPSLSFNFQNKFDYLTLLSLPLVFLNYTIHLITYYKLKIIRYIYIIISIISVFILISPTYIFTKYLLIIHFLIFISLILFLYILIKKFKYSKNMIGFTIFSLVLTSLTVINDILLQNQLIQSVFLSNFGFLFSIIAQSFIISKLYSNSFIKAEKLNEDLEVFNKNLEYIVEERTKLLNNALESENLEKEKALKLKTLAEGALKNLQEAQTQLIESERMASLGQLVGGVAHEINNPIGVIKSNSELIAFNLKIVIKDIPKLLRSLSDEEIEILYSIIDSSINNKEFLSSREERAIKKEITKELEKIISETPEKLDFIVEQILILKIKSHYKSYIDKIGISKFIETLSVAQVFINQSNSIRNIEIAIEKASRVIFSLRSYLKTEIYFEKKDIEVDKEIKKAIHLYDNYILGKVNLNLYIPYEIKMKGIIENLSQVWKNLIFNSLQAMYNTEKNLELRLERLSNLPERLKYMRSSAQIEDIGTDSQSWIVFSIIDSGTGIPNDIQDKIFKPFFTTKALGEGIGLGLYVSRKIVHEHGGRIYFESKEGRTEFLVTLPFNMENEKNI